MSAVLRDRVETGEKQQRTGVFETPEGALFAPTARMWEIHYAAAECRFWDGKEWTVRALRAAIEERLGRKIPQWLFGKVHLRRHDWFYPWLLRGQLPPPTIRVVPPSVLAWARRAWDYSSHLRKAGVTNGVYRKWLDELIPRDDNWLQWVKWLYGDPEPSGFFVVDEAIQKVRRERQIKRILAAARISRHTFWLWSKSETAKEALARALEVATSSGHVEGLAGFASWENLNARAKQSMWRYAKAAVMDACCERAGVHPTQITGSLSRAKKLGVREYLERYLAVEGRGKDHKKSGLLGMNFFVPAPGMLVFRAAAQGAAAEKSIRLSDWRDQPGFTEWFLDSVIPRPMRGARRGVPPPASDGPVSPDGDPAAPPSGDAVPNLEPDPWSEAKSPTEWAQIFDVHYNTMIHWLRTQTILNDRISPRRYRIAVSELPAAAPE
jgi:hypothetical protein